MVVRLHLFLRCLIVLVWTLASIPADAARPEPSISLLLESPEILLGDTVVLEIESVGLDQPIDLAPLAEIATIGRETYGTRIAVIGGQVVEIKLRRIDIVPKTAGTIIIGPLQAGDVHSNSVSVSVLADAPADWTPGDDDAQLEMTVSTPSPYVQQEVVLDIIFSHRDPVLSETFNAPDLTGFRVVPVWQERRTLDQEKGWRRIAWRYLLYPEHSGAITIPALSMNGEMVRSRLERGDFLVTAPPISMDVKPSAMAGGTWWLPARGLKMSEEWSQDVRQLNAGDEVIRTISVSAMGVSASQIPDITIPEARGLAVTLLGAKRSQEVTPQGMRAFAVFRFRVRALSPIPVFPDTIRLKWWDTDTNQARESIIPARRIDIGIPNRDALLNEAEAGRSLAGRVADWLRLTTGPGLLAASALAMLIVALLIAGHQAISGVLDGARQRWRDMRNLAVAKKLASRGDDNQLYRHLENSVSATSRLTFDQARDVQGARIFAPGTHVDADTVIAAIKARQANAKVPPARRIRQTSSLPEL